MGLPAQAKIADLGCGTGTTALMLARDFDFHVSAIDISSINIERAVERAELDDISVQFSQADAHELPFYDGELDAVLAECTFSLFSDQTTVLAEIKRVLKPGGCLAITDMATGGVLADDIAEILAPWTCLATAVDQASYSKMFMAAGFEIRSLADESTGLLSLIKTLKRKLLLLGTGALLANHDLQGFDLATIKFWLDRFEMEVKQGNVRYLHFNLKL